VLGIDEILGAKPAADIGRDKPHRCRSNAEGAGGVVAGRVNALARNVRRVPARTLIPQADNAARLDRVDDDAVIVELHLDDVGRFGEGSIDSRGIAGAPVEADIAGDLGRNFRRSGGTSGGGSRHSGQWSIIHHHQLSGVVRLSAGLSDDQRHRLAGITHPSLGQ